MKSYIVNVVILCLLPVFAHADLGSRVEAIMDISDQIQELHIRKETAFFEINPGASSYMKLNYLISEREGSILGQLGLSIRSKEERDAERNWKTHREPKEDPQKIADAINELMQTREILFQEIFLDFPEKRSQLLQLKKELHQADKNMALSEARILPHVFRSPYPTAHSDYVTEYNKRFPSEKKLAISKAELRVNDATSTQLRRYSEMSDKRIQIADEAIHNIDIILKVPGGSEMCSGLF